MILSMLSNAREGGNTMIGALGGNRTHDPRLRRSQAVNQMIKHLITLIITAIQHQHIARNQDGHSALCYQYRHALISL